MCGASTGHRITSATDSNTDESCKIGSKFAITITGSLW